MIRPRMLTADLYGHRDRVFLEQRFVELGVTVRRLEQFHFMCSGIFVQDQQS